MSIVPLLPIIEVRLIQTQPELEAMYHQRWLVLRAPLGMAKGTEKDQHEDSSWHLIAIYNQQIIGSARLRQLTPELGSISYVAVLEEFRNQGIGTKLIQQLLEIAKSQNLKTVRLQARTTATNFYKRIGFVAQGEVFDYLSIPHIFMYYKECS